MFNTTIHKTETRVTPVTRVVEKTITPDKVTDMYKDVRAEVEESFVRGFRVENNTMKGVVIELAPDYLNNNKRIYTSFILNGEDHTYHENINEDGYALDASKAIETIGKIFGAHLQKTLMQETAKVYAFNKKIL